MAQETEANSVGSIEKPLIELFPRLVIVGKDMAHTSLEWTEVFSSQRSGRWYGNTFVSARQETPAVGAAFGYEERLIVAQHGYDLLIVETALTAFWESESRCMAVITVSRDVLSLDIVEIAVLYANQLTFNVIVWNLKPMDARFIAIGSEMAEAYDARVETAAVEDEVSSLRTQICIVEETLISLDIENRSSLLRLCPITAFTTSATRFPTFNDDVVFVGKPQACLMKRLAEEKHGKVDRSAIGTTCIAAIGVAYSVERETRVTVVVEWTKSLMASHNESQSLSDLLYWKVAKILDIKSIHSFFVCYRSIILAEHTLRAIHLIDELCSFPLADEDTFGSC